MLDPICKRKITPAMLTRDMLLLRDLIERLEGTRYAGCIPSLQERLSELFGISE